MKKLYCLFAMIGMLLEGLSNEANAGCYCSDTWLCYCIGGTEDIDYNTVVTWDAVTVLATSDQSNGDCQPGVNPPVKTWA